MNLRLMTLVAMLGAATTSAARADTFLLKSGHRVYGIRETEESDKTVAGKTWTVIRTSFGRVRVDKAQIDKVLPAAGRKDTVYLDLARIYTIHGTAERSVDDGKTWEKIAWGVPAGATTDRAFDLPVVKAGSRIRTAENSEVVLDVAYGLVLLSASSELKLMNEEGATIDLLRGRAGVKVEDLPSDRRFRVETPQSSLAVKGTLFLADASTGGCAVAEGSVVVGPLGATTGQTVPSGNSVVRGSALAPIAEEDSSFLAGVADGGRFAIVDWIVVPGGSFLMGGDDGCPCNVVQNLSTFPAHDVSLSSFLMSKTEVTEAQIYLFRRWTTINRKSFSDVAARTAKIGEHTLNFQPFNGSPIVFNDYESDWPMAVTWAEADAASRWLGGRLPSEAEWEYAARCGGPKSSDRELIQSAWGGSNSGMKLHPVGALSGNRWGLHDMIGNLDEWTADSAVDGYAGAPSDGTARAAGSKEHVIRGLNFWSRLNAAAVFTRYRGYDQSPTTGFRPARPMVTSPR